MTDDAGYGPAMAALNEMQRRFVLAFIETPSISQAGAARAAGYSDVADGAKVRGHYLAHNPRVQAAIREEAGKRLNSLSLRASNFLMEVLDDETAPIKERTKVALAVLDRTGFAAAQNINVNKTVTDLTPKAIEGRIRRAVERLEKLGRDPVSLLGRLAAPVDAEFKVVDEK